MPTIARRSSWVASRTLIARVAFAITKRSLHVNPFRGHLDDHALLIRPESPELPTGVFAGQLLDVLVRALGDQLGPAANRERVVVGPRRIEDCDRHPVVALQILGLQAR